MSDVPTTLSLLVLAQTHRGDVVDQINRSVQFLRMVPIVTGQGKNCAWAVEKDGELVENYSEAADASNFGTTSQQQAILTWALYRANPRVSQLAMDAAASSYDPVGNKQAWAHQLVKHASLLAQTLNEKCFAGPGTGTEICGLDEAICKDDNIYANINRATGGNEFWKPTKVDPGSPTAPTFADMRDDQRKIYEACGESADLAFCKPIIFNYIGGLFDQTRRQVETITTARGQITLNAGFHALEMDGMLYIKERHATASRIYYVNSTKLHLEVLPTAEQRMLEDSGVFMSADDGFGSVPLSFHYQPLAKTGASDKAQILSTCQLVVPQPNCHGVRLNVATS